MTEAAIIVPIVFGTFAFIIKVISDNRLKKIMIEKGKVDESVKLFNVNAVRDPLNNIKWGIVLIGIGAAILLAQLFPYSITDEAMIGLMFLFAGFGFIAYYAMSKSMDKDQQL